MIDKRVLSFLNIFILSNKIQTVMDRSLVDVSAKQWVVLITLGTFKEAPTLKDLAFRCGITHQSTMQLVKKLEEKGYLHIKTDSKDKRAIRIYFTEKMESWNQQYNNTNINTIKEVFSDLTENELQVFCNAQFKLYDRLEIMEKQD